MELRPIRAEGHRSFIGPEFGGRANGEDPSGLTIAEIMADPKTAALGMSVYQQLREQFSEGGVGIRVQDSTYEADYRRRLEGWADILETLLEETVNELDRLKSGGIVIPGDPAES